MAAGSKSTGTSPARRTALSDALAEAAWMEADAALAEALICIDELERARGARRRTLLQLIGQALTRAARRRGLTRIGEAGAVVDYDRETHDLDGRRRNPATVRIVGRGVARGGKLLRKPRVRAAE